MALFSFIFIRGYYLFYEYENKLGLLTDGEYRGFDGKVVSKSEKENSILYEISGEFYVYAYYETDDIPIGAYVELYGEICTFDKATNEGMFDLAFYRKTQGVHCAVFCSEINVLSYPSHSFREMLYRIRSKVSHAFESCLDDRDSGILGSIVLGDKSVLPEEIREQYEEEGISHLLAISGLHISLLGSGIYKLLKRFKISTWISRIISLVVVLFYFFISGCGVSSQRAVLMYAIFLFSEFVGRRYCMATSILLAAIVILAINPLSVFQSAFIYSFGAVIGILIVTPAFLLPEDETRYDQINYIYPDKSRAYKDISRGIINDIASSIGLQLFLIPITAWNYYEVPLLSFLLNVPVLYFAGWLLGFGMLGSVAVLAFPEIAKWFFVVCHFILSFYEMLMDFIGRIPWGSQTTGKPAIAWMILYYFIVFFAAMIWKVKKSRKIFIAAGVMLVFMIFAPGKEYFRIDMLDVGQGDGIHIADGSGVHIMIDGGSTDEGGLGKYRIEPFLRYNDIDHVDYWLVSHGDDDHISGLTELLEGGYDIDYLILPLAMPKDDAYYTLQRLAEINDTKVVTAAAADKLEMQYCRLTMIYPDDMDAYDEAEINSGEYDRNALSAVWFLETDMFNMLFTGDLGKEGEEELAQKGILPNVDILKVAHHGSKNSTSEEFLDALSPEAALISAGEGNLYGHPSGETITRLENIGCSTFVTMDYGQIKITKSGTGYKISFPCIK